MIVIQMLLPRFLVLEVVLFFHFLQLGQCSKKVSAKIESKDEGMKRKRFHENSSVTENVVFFHNETVTDNSHLQYEDCKINIDDLDLKWMPMFYSIDKKSFLMPTIDEDEISRKSIKRGRKRKEKTRLLHIERSRNLIIAMCPGTTFKGKTKSHQCLYCVGGKIMSDENFCSNHSPSLSVKEVKLSNLSCAQSIKETIVSSDDKCGPPSGNGKIIQVGWTNEHINDASSFTPQITVCHDSFNENTYYTNHTLFGLSVQARDKRKSRHFNFKEGGTQFYAKSSAKSAYTIASQKTLFQRLLTNPDERSKIFSKKRRLYLSKGHLSPNADFIWNEWQQASYYYFNAAPQWQSINGGNWNEIEEIVRKYAYQNRVRLNIFTGTKGQLSVGKSKFPLSLVSDIDDAGNSIDLIPVPLHFWKLVYSVKQNAAIIFVSVNDPQFNTNLDDSQSTSHYKSLCPKDDPRLCEQKGWNIIENTDSYEGYVYCCSVGGFNEILSWIPQHANIPDNVDILTMK